MKFRYLIIEQVDHVTGTNDPKIAEDAIEWACVIDCEEGKWLTTGTDVLEEVPL